MSVSRPRGFTLIEILATLGVLAIGLASVVGLVLGSTRMSAGAIDKNTASIILSEAVEDITRIHLITSDQLTALGLSARSAEVGRYIETVNTTPAGITPEWPNIQFGDFTNARANAVNLSDYISPTLPNTMIWPPSSSARFYGGPLVAGSRSSGTAFRAIYRLERHPDWIASLPPNLPVPSAYEGIYVLTLAIYKDLDPNPTVMPVTNPKHRYQQVSDPVVVLLRTKN
jgi:prepilin-type N-terminal cleavage/methylation domain-containing protein